MDSELLLKFVGYFPDDLYVLYAIWNSSTSMASDWLLPDFFCAEDKYFA